MTRLRFYKEARTIFDFTLPEEDWDTNTHQTAIVINAEDRVFLIPFSSFDWMEVEEAS